MSQSIMRCQTSFSLSTIQYSRRHKMYRMYSGTRSFLFRCQHRNGEKKKKTHKQTDLPWMQFCYFTYQPFSRPTRKDDCSCYFCRYVSLRGPRKTSSQAKKVIIFFYNSATPKQFEEGQSIFFNVFSYFLLVLLSIYFNNFDPFLQPHGTCSAQLDLHMYV